MPYFSYTFTDPHGTAVAARDQADAMIRTIEGRMLAFQESGQPEQARQFLPMPQGYKA